MALLFYLYVAEVFNWYINAFKERKNALIYKKLLTKGGINMKRLIKGIVTSISMLALILNVYIVSTPAATEYTPVGGTTTIVKNLVVDSDANIPDVSFSFQIRRGTPQDATATTVEILNSFTGASSIGIAEFSNADTANTIPGLPSDADPTHPTAGKKYAQKQITVSFQNTTFTKPGVYRYVIEETNNHLPGVTYDTTLLRYLDVFVVSDENNVLSVDSYVLRDNASDISKNGDYVTNPGEKSAGYTNVLTQHDFTFNKTISGNQGDKNKRFTFTLNIQGANPGVYPLVTNDVTGSPTYITVENNGTLTTTFSLTNGSSVQILGLNQGASCTVSEAEEDYTASYVIDGGSSVAGNNSGSITLANSDHTVAFTNTRTGIIPTGIIISIAPYAIGLLLFGAIAIFTISRGRRMAY